MSFLDGAELTESSTIPSAEEDYSWDDEQRLFEKACLGIVLEFGEYPSKSGLPNRHVILKLSGDLPIWQRIALQAALGSDPRRELLSAIRHIKGMSKPIILFRPKALL